RRPRRHHAALGGVADHDGDRLALGAERRERHAQLRPAGTRHYRHQRAVAGAVGHRLPGADHDRHPGLGTIHGDHLPRRALVDPRRSLRGRQARGRQRLGHRSTDHAAADPAVHQHRGGDEHHLRLQLIPHHLGHHPGWTGELHRYPRHLPLQARLSPREAGRGVGALDHDVRAAARIHHPLRAAGHAEFTNMTRIGRKWRRTIFSWIVLSPLIVLVLFPFAVMFITAIKPATEVLRPTWWPGEMRLQNFLTMWEATGFGQALWNSVYVAVLSTAIALLVSIPAAYAMSRYRFAARGFLQQFLLVSQMLSPIVLVIGLFRLVVWLGLIDNINSIVFVYAAFNIAFSVWML